MLASGAAWLCTVWLAAQAESMRVLVTGAGGRTGRLVFEELKQLSGEFSPVGLARSKKAKKLLRKTGASDNEIVSADVNDKPALVQAMRGFEAIVLCTSAVPQIKPWSIVKLLFKKSILRRPDPGRPQFRFGPQVSTCWSLHFCFVDVAPPGHAGRGGLAGREESD